MINPALCLALPRSGSFFISCPLFIAGLILATVLLLGLLALLCTTPPDAIKLPVRRSIILITAGTAWLAAVHALAVERTFLGWIGAVALAAATSALASTLGRRTASPWWAVLLAWNPLFVGPGRMPLLYAVIATAAVAIFVGLTRPRAGETEELTP